ncbi:hypothetical protein BDZ45DRAFT_53043 [Acephala macrosclerotiorum]|nr:hypothetical protein BDZ45DRAFT_53043 [Acephala macrosclerotiorum]
MTSVDNHSRTDDIYDPDDVGQKSPLLKPMKVSYEPSPSPPPTVPIPSDSPESSPGSPSRKGSSRPKFQASQGDAVLVSFMAGGKYSDIARDAGQQPLAFDNEVEESPKGGTAVTVEKEDEVVTEDEDMVEKEATSDDDVAAEKQLLATATIPEVPATPPTEPNPAPIEENGFDLKALAARAMAATSQTAHATPDELSRSALAEGSLRRMLPPQSEPEQMEGVKLTIPSITTLYVDGQSARSPDAAIKREMPTSPSGAGELPPILHTLPQSGLTNGNGSGQQITLPSISDQLGDLSHLPEPPSASDSGFSQSPPGRPPPRFSAVPGHGSPPKSPNDTFRRELPSPGRGHFYSFANSHRRPSQTDGHQYPSPADYSSSNTETPSTDQSASTPATMGIDRMSIDNMTNPQIGGFQCTYPGCTAQPFQTQYLLNSHANVHSSIRPHYCSVKGCPRSEGGKGFKRKNEMIRHGLVHDSPGYVCPFCPDREHKYPRPDNLQRHVRVHHVDKDKDDPQLREVLSQRPEGPSRGRRRRGGTS